MMPTLTGKKTMPAPMAMPIERTTQPQSVESNLVAAFHSGTLRPAFRAWRCSRELKVEVSGAVSVLIAPLLLRTLLVHTHTATATAKDAGAAFAGLQGSVHIPFLHFEFWRLTQKPSAAYKPRLHKSVLAAPHSVKRKLHFQTSGTGPDLSRVGSTR